MDMQSWLIADYYLSNLIKQTVTLAFTNVRSSIFSMPYLKYFHQFFPWVLLPLGLVILKWHLGSIIISWNLTLYLTCLWIQVGTNNLNFLFCAGGICDPGDAHENDVVLYAKIEGRKEHITLDTLSYSSYKVHMLVLVPNGPSPEGNVKITKAMLEGNSLF